MKRKGERSIPDFSGRKKGTLETRGTEPNRVKGQPRAPADRAVKPQSTSAKSGRRGS